MTLEQIFRLRDKYLGKETTGYEKDKETGSIIVYGINAVYIDGVYYSLEDGRILLTENYVEEIRRYIGKRALQVPGTGVVVYRKVNGEIEIYLQERVDCQKYGLSGGAIELGETYEECAINELEQETALIAKQEDLKLFKVYAGPKHVTKYEDTGDVVFHSVIVYLLDYQKCRKANHEVDKNETKSLEWFKLYEVENLLDQRLVFPNNAPILRDIVNAFKDENAD